ncbi:MAG TPA: hypothetical protein VK181_06700, partial [Rhizobium sp.]|nr:hypothetical protein [Rhizobium sp.]
MADMWKAGLVVATLAAGSAAWTVAEAQGLDPYRSDTLLVTPEGDILGYTPEEGEVVVSRDQMGRRVLIDRRGRVIATEVRADTYFPRRRPGAEQPGYDDFGAPAPGWEDDGVVTGAIPERGTVDRAPLDQPLPDMPSGGPDMPPPVDQAPQTIVTPDIPVKSNLSQLEITALQVFLDREGASPGVIDGKMGQNVNKSLVAWQEMTGETIDPNNAEDILERLRMSGGMAVTSYTITPGDAAGPYVASIPEDYSLKAELPSLAYTSTVEMLAEKFHMDENYLRALNPGVDFTVPGTIIKVVEPGKPKTGKVARIVADKGKKQVFAYGEDGSLVAAYPASIGS